MLVKQRVQGVIVTRAPIKKKLGPLRRTMSMPLIPWEEPHASLKNVPGAGTIFVAPTGSQTAYSSFDHRAYSMLVASPPPFALLSTLSQMDGLC